MSEDISITEKQIAEHACKFIETLRQGLASDDIGVQEGCREILMSMISTSERIPTPDLREILKTWPWQTISAVLSQSPREELLPDLIGIANMHVVGTLGVRLALVSMARVAIPDLTDLPQLIAIEDLIAEIQRLRPEWELSEQTPLERIFDRLEQEIKRLGEDVQKALAARFSPVAALLGQEFISIPSPSVYYNTICALSNKHMFTQSEESPWPTARQMRDDGTTVIQLMPEEARRSLPAAQQDYWVERMWENHKALSDLDADCLDALMAIWLASASAPTDDAIADVDHLLELRGLTKKPGGSGRRGGFTSAQREEFLDSTFRLEDLWIEFEGVKRKGKKSQPEVVRSRAISISDTKGQRRLDGAIDVHTFLFSPGRVFGAYMWAEGRQTALLSAQALKYDPYRQGPEKKLTRYLAWQWKIRARQGNYIQPFGIRTLLEETSIEINRGRGARTKERLEKALEQLLADSVIVHWDWDKWNEKRDGNGRGWFDKWLGANVVIEPPDTIRDHYNGRGLERESAPAKPRKALASGSIGEHLAQVRKMRRLSQAVTAEDLGITQAYLSLIERGKVKLSKTLTAKIEVWIGAS